MNPYAIGFGRIPNSFINRDIITDEILEAFTSPYVDAQCYKITGIRGSGKTVIMSVVEQTLKKEKDWICIDVSSESAILQDLIRLLYEDVPFVKDYVNATLNLSAFGISTTLETETPTTSEELAAHKLLEIVKSKGKRVLVTIDELRKTEEAVKFIKFFQLAVRHELPIYFLSTGLLKDMSQLENTDGLTFFYRAEKKNADPLDLNLIAEDYKKQLGVSQDQARLLARITEGYAFAYQAVGKYLYESGQTELTSEVLNKIDAALAGGAYQKIWSELTAKEQEYVSWLSKHEFEFIDVSLILQELTIKKTSWSVIRANLAEKQLIDISTKGKVRFLMPRFSKFVEDRIEIY